MEDVDRVITGETFMFILFCDTGSAVSDSKIQIKRESQITMVSTAATMRVLNVLRHWVSKHAQVRGDRS